MNTDLYERIWMWATGVMLALFFGTLANASLRGGLHPPSHVETIDPKRVFQHPAFKTRGVWLDPKGAVHASVVGITFTWLPAELTVPADTPVTFHLASPDVTHSFLIVATNGQAMIVPGYVSQFTTQFGVGEYLIACSEYCGVGHHTMAGKLHVVPKAQWRLVVRDSALGTRHSAGRGGACPLPPVPCPLEFGTQHSAGGRSDHRPPATGHSTAALREVVHAAR